MVWTLPVLVLASAFVVARWPSSPAVEWLGAATWTALLIVAPLAVMVWFIGWLPVTVTVGLALLGFLLGRR